MTGRKPKGYVILERKNPDGSIYYTAYTERRRLFRFDHEEKFEKHFVCERRYQYGQEYLVRTGGTFPLELWNEEYLLNAENVFLKKFKDALVAEVVVCRLVREQRDKEANRNYCRVVSEGECCE
jgi:hypothetical protein